LHLNKIGRLDGFGKEQIFKLNAKKQLERVAFFVVASEDYFNKELTCCY